MNADQGPKADGQSGGVEARSATGIILVGCSFGPWPPSALGRRRRDRGGCRGRGRGVVAAFGGGPGALRDRSGVTRRGHAIGHRHRHGQSGADDHRRQLCVRRHPAAVLRLQYAGQGRPDLRQDRSAPLPGDARPVCGPACCAIRPSSARTGPISRAIGSSRRRTRSRASRPKTRLYVVQQDEATVKLDEALVEGAKLNLGYTDIVSPVDGTVVSRNVTQGQTVAASFQTPTLFLIATDLKKMEVDTNISESDIGGVKEGDKADLHRRRLSRTGSSQGTVTQVRQSPQTVQNVVTYDVVVSVDNQRSGADAGHDRVDADRRRPARRRAARAGPGAALRAGRPRRCRRPPRRRAVSARVWVLRDGKPVAVAGRARASTTRTSPRSSAGDLQPGDRVITAERSDAARAAAGRAAAAALRARSMPREMPDNAEPVIRIESVTRTFVLGDVEVQALHGVDLTVERGEFVAIMGSSGSGKSTLMNILGCLDPPTSGHYFLEGVDVAGLSEPELARIRSERLGFVFQSFNLLARTSAIENVGLPLYYAASGPLRRASATERARAALQFVGLGERERNTPGQLSGGQQQRVAIARALINTPSLLLADEPTGNLDTRTSHEIMETLVTLNRDQGVTIVLVTHEPDIAAYADRDRDDARRRDRLRRAGGEAGAVPAPRGTRRAPRSPARPAAAPLLALPTGRHSSPFALMILAAAAQAIGAQQDALGAHHARRLHRRRGAHRHGRRRRGRQRGGAQADREPRHQRRRDPAGRRHDRRHPRRLRQRQHAHRRRCARHPPRGSGRVAKSATSSASRGRSSTAIRTGPRPSKASAPTIRRSPTGGSPPAAAFTEDDESKAALVAVIGQTVYRQLFDAGENSARRRHPGEGRAAPRHRRAACQGPVGLRPGPGRPRDDPVHDGRAQGARRRRAEPAADAAQLALSAAAQPLQSAGRASPASPTRSMCRRRASPRCRPRSRR